MRERYVRLILSLVLAASFAGCDVASPARPAVSFVAPAGTSPSSGVVFNFSDQPVVLTIVNSVRTGAAVVTYRVEVATSDTFVSPVFTREGIPEGTTGVTTVQLSPLDGDRTYFWRWRAVLDGIVGEPSARQSFSIRPNIVIQAPQLLTPAGTSPVFSARPTFTIQNASRTGPAGTIFYEFQVSASASFNPLTASSTVQEQPNQTSWTTTVDLGEGTYFWRVRASDPASALAGPFSGAGQFERRGFGSGDQIDLSSVTIVLGAQHIASFPATSQVTSATAQTGGLCINHTKLGVWPGTTFFGDPNTLAEGNQWIFAFIGGKWYGGAGHWYRPGQPCKDVDRFSVAGGTFYQDGTEPLRSWVPAVGETFAVMSATPARFWPDMKTVDERTNVVLLKWGG